MNVEDLGNLGETLSGIAVVASLIYLIFEVRRNTRSVRTKSAWDGTNSLAELSQFLFIARSVLFKYEAQWHMWAEGSLSDEMW